MTRRRARCYHPWYGDCSASIVREHCCARPPDHPEPHMCACGEKPSPDGQEALFSDRERARRDRMKAAGIAAQRRRRERVA